MSLRLDGHTVRKEDYSPVQTDLIHSPLVNEPVKYGPLLKPGETSLVTDPNGK